MKMQTTRFGDFNVDDSKIIKLEEGLLGFEQLHCFVLIPLAEDSPFLWFQSLDDPDITFVVTDPWTFRPDYHAAISREEMRHINAERLEHVVALVILTIPENPNEITANLKGPIIINTKSFLGQQVVLSDPAYHTRHLISEELERIKEIVDKVSPVSQETELGGLVTKVG